MKKREKQKRVGKLFFARVRRPPHLYHRADSRTAQHSIVYLGKKKGKYFLPDEFHPRLHYCHAERHKKQ